MKANLSRQKPCREDLNEGLKSLKRLARSRMRVKKNDKSLAACFKLIRREWNGRSSKHINS